jgi:mRNA interferase RelE/StbE
VKLILSPAAVKNLRRMPRKDAAALMKKLETVAVDPFGARPWAKRLAGAAAFRVRQGDWRAVYRIDRETRQVVVDHIDHRREVYR